ncbi:hypothetical protein N8972_01065 [Sulfurospirillum sp.]|nr:hypothetical protein [Sulfurospirillum sp.]
MKLTKILLAMTIATTISFAASAEDINTKTMAGMENGLNNIQKGFLYNNFDLVRHGASQIREENKIYHDKEMIQSILPKGKQQMENVAMITSNRIDNALTELKIYIELKDIRKAQDAFSDVVKACTDCHNIVRGW